MIDTPIPRRSVLVPAPSTDVAPEPAPVGVTVHVVVKFQRAFTDADAAALYASGDPDMTVLSVRL